MDADQLRSLDVSDALKLLGSSPDGLSLVEVDARRRVHGWNEIGVATRRAWPRMLSKHFLNFFSLLLTFSTALCFLANRLRPGENMALLGWALLGVAVLNGIFAFAQEYRAERAMEELTKLLPRQVRVRRGGKSREIPARELVPGDLFDVATGDRIPADARLVRGDGVQVSNSPLTGESRPLSLHPYAIRATHLSEASNLLFAGCVVMRGEGLAVAFATGGATEFGKVAQLSHQVGRPRSPLEREVARMTRVLTFIATSMGLLFFTYGVFSGQPLINNLVFMMGIIVANVPEGLLPTLTLALSMGSLRMANKQVLVKSLHAVETLGAVQIICTDKTGTLTADQLALAAAYGCENLTPLKAASRQELLRIALVASDVRPQSAGQFTGDPMDVALAIEYGRAAGDVERIVSHTRRHIPFDARHRRQAGLLVSGTERLLAVKGAWESIRDHIHREVDLETGAERTIGHSELDALDSRVTAMARLGHRIIAVARAERTDSQVTLALESPDAWEPPRLTLAGFLAWEDPVRPEVPAALAQCRRAGIRVVIITGDHPDTATAVARRIGLVDAEAESRSCCLHGEELERLDDVDLRQGIAEGICIFARTTPEQKLKIVQALKQDQAVIAMTGDGVNDAPALKAADVGIAMGKGGTDVAREAADVILLDNNFASIVAGIAEGRAVFRNIRRFTDYVLASNVPEIVPYLLFILLPVPLGLTILQILAIDLGTDILPAIGLGQEPPEDDLMEQPPRRRDEPLLSSRLLRHAYLFFGPLEALVSLSLFFGVLHAGGWTYGESLPSHDPLYQSATGMTLAAVVLLQMGNLIARRSESRSGLDRQLFKNRILLAGLLLEGMFVVAILAWAPLQRVLATGPVPPWAIFLALLAVPLTFLLDLSWKRYNRVNPVTPLGARHAR